MRTFSRLLIFALALCGLAACASARAERAAEPEACLVTEPVRATPPDDAAVQNPPAEGEYFVNADRSIWASASWAVAEPRPARLEEYGLKVGWFRPAGATLEISGRRLDAPAPPLEAHVPCCYPTRFQATGLSFPTEGCWEITARAADEELTFVVEIALRDATQPR